MVLMGEDYAHYRFVFGFGVGFGHIPGTSDLGTRNATRSDKRGSQTEVVTKKLNTASAEISDFYSIYVETPGYGSGNGQGIFLKAASNQMTVNTTETLETGSSYGEDEVTGYTLGLGWKGSFSEDGKGLHAKFIAEYSDFDTLSFKGSADDASEFSTITADSETYGLKISLGYNF